MSSAQGEVVGTGDTARTLPPERVRALVEEGMGRLPLDGARVLAVVPDHTRSAPMGLVFPAVLRALTPRARSVEVMVALGTHRPERESDVRERLGLRGDRSIPIHQHEWDRDDALREAGCIGSGEIAELSGGLFRQDVCVRANKRLFEADHVLIVGPVFPHEVAGFSGGTKYLFPGCSGPEVLNFFHWLGAVITNLKIIGVKENPVRRVIDRAAELVPVPKSCVAMVVEPPEGLAGLYVGPVGEAWSRAADLSARTHVTYVERPFRRVLSMAPPMYDDLWTAAKCMYKLEPVVEDGGELVIYAPHVAEVSYTHGRYLDEVGYHVRDYFLKQWERFSHYPWSVLAHSTHVKGAGSYDEVAHIETPRVNVVLATGIPEERCRRINLGWRDPRSIRPEDWEHREAEGVLCVRRSGERLYRLAGAVARRGKGL